MSYDAERKKKPQVTDAFEHCCQTELCVLGLNGTLLSLQGEPARKAHCTLDKFPKFLAIWPREKRDGAQAATVRISSDLVTSLLSPARVFRHLEQPFGVTWLDAGFILRNLLQSTRRSDRSLNGSYVKPTRNSLIGNQPTFIVVFSFFLSSLFAHSGRDIETGNG
jgi:hypothetical protein